MSVEFPIKTTIVYNGVSSEKQLNERDRVRCYYCNAPILLVRGNVFVVDQYGGTAVKCPKCKKLVDTFYYYDRVINEPIKRNKKNR